MKMPERIVGVRGMLRVLYFVAQHTEPWVGSDGQLEHREPILRRGKACKIFMPGKTRRYKQDALDPQKLRHFLRAP